jgi:hypothetical protein
MKRTFISSLICLILLAACTGTPSRAVPRSAPAHLQATAAW